MKKILIFILSLTIVSLTFLNNISVEASESYQMPFVDELLMLINNSRAEFGIEPLSIDPNLRIAAKNKVTDMYKNQYFAHYYRDCETDGLSTPWKFIRNAGYDYKHAGENLSINYWSAKDVHTAFMNSPSHRANIMNMEYKNIGIGARVGMFGDMKSFMVVEMFGSK